LERIWGTFEERERGIVRVWRVESSVAGTRDEEERE